MGKRGVLSPGVWTGSCRHLCIPSAGAGRAGTNRLLTFSWVRMFSHCSFTERLWITLKSQAQKTLTARLPMELPTR